MEAVSKWNGTGNDFIIIPGDVEVGDETEVTRRLCDRDTGLDDPQSRRTGADGVLFLTREEGSPQQVTMHHVQPDGSTPDMCGNGVRCAAKWASQHFGATNVVVQTGAGPHPATVTGDGVTVTMRQPSLEPADIPLNRNKPLYEESVEDLIVTAVTTGVPHAVAFQDDISNMALSDVAPPVRHADVFPDGANVTLSERIEPGRYAQRTYERGVEGETDACGTGAVAIAAAAVATGRADAGKHLDIEPPGGRLTVSVSEDQTTLAGPVEHEFSTDLETIQADYDVPLRAPGP